jgi:hypothetical protein
MMWRSHCWVLPARCRTHLAPPDTHHLLLPASRCCAWAWRSPWVWTRARGPTHAQLSGPRCWGTPPGTLPLPPRRHQRRPRQQRRTRPWCRGRCSRCCTAAKVRPVWGRARLPVPVARCSARLAGELATAQTQPPPCAFQASPRRPQHAAATKRSCGAPRPPLRQPSRPPRQQQPAAAALPRPLPAVTALLGRRRRSLQIVPLARKQHQSQQHQLQQQQQQHGCLTSTVTWLLLRRRCRCSCPSLRHSCWSWQQVWPRAWCVCVCCIAIACVCVCGAGRVGALCVHHALLRVGHCAAPASRCQGP